MLRKILLGLLLLLVALVALPPLWGALFAPAPPELPPPGRRVLLPSGAGMNVLEAGAGPAVLLLHGLPGMAYDWRELTRELTGRGVRVVAVDRIGYGHSDPDPQGDYSIGRNASDLIALLETLELDDLTLVGWSYGGVVSIVTAVRAPEHVSRLVLIGTGGPDGPDARRPELPGLLRFLYSTPVLHWRARVPAIGRVLIEATSRQAFSVGAPSAPRPPVDRVRRASHAATPVDRPERLPEPAPPSDRAKPLSGVLAHPAPPVDRAKPLPEVLAHPAPPVDRAGPLPEPMPDWWLPGVAANFARWETLLAYRGEMFSTREEPDFLPDKVQHPTLLLHGDDDRLATVGIGRYLATQIPDATLIEFTKGSHMLPITHAAEVAERIVAFQRQP